MGQWVSSDDGDFITRWDLFYKHLDHGMYRPNSGLIHYWHGGMPRSPSITPKTCRFAMQHIPEATIDTSLHTGSHFAD
jgi:hypothetical protein